MAPLQDDVGVAWWELSPAGLSTECLNMPSSAWEPPRGWTSYMVAQGSVHWHSSKRGKLHHLFWPSLWSHAMSLFCVLLFTSLTRVKGKGHGPHLWIRGVSNDLQPQLFSIVLWTHSHHFNNFCLSGCIFLCLQYPLHPLCLSTKLYSPKTHLLLSAFLSPLGHMLST